MAEAFARAYGSDVIMPVSAGFAPAAKLPPDTVRAMSEKDVDITAQIPKSLSQLGRAEFDLVINMSGYPLPKRNGTTIREWDVADPIAMEYGDHCKIRDQIESKVMALILELRQAQKQAAKQS